MKVLHLRYITLLLIIFTCYACGEDTASKRYSKEAFENRVDSIVKQKAPEIKKAMQEDYQRRKPIILKSVYDSLVQKNRSQHLSKDSIDNTLKSDSTNGK